MVQSLIYRKQKSHRRIQGLASGLTQAGTSTSLPPLPPLLLPCLSSIMLPCKSASGFLLRWNCGEPQGWVVSENDICDPKNKTCNQWSHTESQPQKGICTWGLMLCVHCLDRLHNFVFKFVLCEWDPMGQHHMCQERRASTHVCPSHCIPASPEQTLGHLLPLQGDRQSPSSLQGSMIIRMPREHDIK